MAYSTVKKGRILFFTRGRVSDPLADSGSSYNLYRSLSNCWGVSAVSVKLRGWRRYVCALYALTISPRRLHQAYHVNLWAFQQKTKLCEQALRRHRGQYDLVFQMYATHAPTLDGISQPYVVYGDATHRMAELEYPPWDTFRPGQRRRWYRLETRLYQQASLIFARSTRMKRSLVDFYKVDPEKVLVVGAGINYGSWPKHPKKYDSQMLLFVGKDFVRKGGPGLLEALDLVRRQIPEAHLTIAGPKEPVRRDGVQFLGRVNDRKRLQQLYTKATLFVMPSIYEPWGNVYTEAMAHKLPCIGTHVGGVPDIIVDGETGYLVPPNQPQILADRILRLLRNPDMAREMGERGYRRAMQEFTWDRVVERMQPHLDHLMISQKP